MIFNRWAGIFTVVVLIFTEVFVRSKIPSTSNHTFSINEVENPSTSNNASNSTSMGGITNSLPFSTLNISFALGIVFHILVNVVFKEPIIHYGIQMSVMLPSLLATNRKAKKHLAKRLWQHKESLTVGRNKSCRISSDINGENTEIGFYPHCKCPNFPHFSTFYTDISAKSVTFCNSGRNNKVDQAPASFDLRNPTHPTQRNPIHPTQRNLTHPTQRNPTHPNLRNPTYPTHSLTHMALIENNRVDPSASFNLGNPTHVTQRNPTHSNLRNPNLPNQRNPTHHPTHNLTPMAWTLETSM